jgi:hypothetical protein
VPQPGRDVNTPVLATTPRVLWRLQRGEHVMEARLPIEDSAWHLYARHRRSATRAADFQPARRLSKDETNQSADTRANAKAQRRVEATRHFEIL